MNEVKIFSRLELSNEDYHKETEHVSGSQLQKLFTTCPAKFRYGVEEDENGEPIIESNRALTFGSCAHSNLLERDMFDKEYLRGTEKTDNPGGIFIKTLDEAKRWLKERGVAGYSTKDAKGLWEMIQAASKPTEEVSFLPIVLSYEEELAKNNNLTLVRGGDYDACLKMRETLFANKDISEFIGKGEPEVSCFAVIDDVPVKVRWDYIYNWFVLDYKTTRDSGPAEFGRQAYNAGYYLKMALQHDVFEIAYGRPPAGTILLAQEKKHPYIPVRYRMSEEQLVIGRMQYRAALQLYKACKEKDVWPAYGGGHEIELQTPAFVKGMYKEIFNDFK